MKYLSLFLFLNISIIFSQAYQDYEDVIYLNNGSVIYGIIIEQIPNEQIKIQSGKNVFVYKMEDVQKIAKELKVNNTHTYSANNTSQNSYDCYDAGILAAKSHSAGGSVVVGSLSGFLLGLIGTGINVAIVSVSNPEPNHIPQEYRDSECRIDYTEGYKKEMKRKRVSGALVGGLLGTVTAVALLY
tara:strand:- start:944 stop:1501 length:558 start_codon:yes stop_codon:yes gene_type:complete